MATEFPGIVSTVLQRGPTRQRIIYFLLRFSSDYFQYPILLDIPCIYPIMKAATPLRSSFSAISYTLH